jgi:hypothetical protein
MSTIELPGQERFRFAKPRPRLGMRAWRVSWGGIDGMFVGFVAAKSRSVARREMFANLLDAGYHPSWPSVKAKRDLKHDAWAAIDSGMKVYAEEYVPTIGGRRCDVTGSYAELVLYMGFVTGALSNRENRQRMLQAVRDNELAAKYLESLRDSLDAILRDAKTEPSNPEGQSHVS